MVNRPVSKTAHMLESETTNGSQPHAFTFHVSERIVYNAF